MKLAWIVLLALAVLFSAATVRGLVVGDLLARGPVVEGTVIGTQRSSSTPRAGRTPVVVVAPVIQIEYPPGTLVELAGATGWNTTMPYQDGDVVSIRVNEVRPDLSLLDSPARVYGVAAVKLGLPLLLWALAFAVRSRM